MLKGKWKDGGATVDLSVYKLVRLRCYLVSSNPSRTMLPALCCVSGRERKCLTYRQWPSEVGLWVSSLFCKFPMNGLYSPPFYKQLGTKFGGTQAERPWCCARSGDTSLEPIIQSIAIFSLFDRMRHMMHMSRNLYLRNETTVCLLDQDNTEASNLRRLQSRVHPEVTDIAKNA